MSEEMIEPCPFCHGPGLAAADYITCGAAWEPGCAGHMVKTDLETWNTRAYNPNERLSYEEIAILHGQQVTVTFKCSADAFALFNELRDRGSALSPLPQGEDT